MSSSDMASLHDVYESLDEEEECKKTDYILQFLWRDITSHFDVIRPYFTIAGTIEAQHLHTFVMKTLLVFNQFEFHVRALLCDGASANLALVKELCAHKKGDDISACFVSLMGTKFILLFVLHIKYYYGPVQEPMGSTCIFL